MGCAFQPEQLDLIDEAFEQAWAVLASQPNGIRVDLEVLKSLLRMKVIALAGAGMRDPELLRQAALFAILKSESELSVAVSQPALCCR